MSDEPAPGLRQIRRGDGVDEIHLIDTLGRITILCAYGLHDDERLRTRERALQLLGEALPR